MPTPMTRAPGSRPVTASPASGDLAGGLEARQAGGLRAAQERAAGLRDVAEVDAGGGDPDQDLGPRAQAPAFTNGVVHGGEDVSRLQACSATRPSRQVSGTGGSRCSVLCSCGVRPEPERGDQSRVAER